MLSLDKVYHANYVLKDVVRRTDMIYSSTLSQLSGCEVYLKTENLQVTGSFKVRGAYYKISQLTDEEKSHGVVACSAGNHAQGVALASRKFGIKSVICMPDGAPISKVEATKSYGAQVELVPGVYDDAHNYAEQLRMEKGYTFIHPFDDEDVIAGQATIGLEVIDQLKDVDAVVVPIGGGGLISGVAFAIKSLNPRIKIYGVQSAGAPSMIQSLKDGRIEMLDSVSTIADGIAVKEPGEHTFELCKKYVDGVVSVTDDQVCAAILALIEKQKMIAEGAGAVSLAAVMFEKIPDIKGKKVVCLISGGNIDVTILSRVINRGLLMSGRTATLTIELMDKPGQLVAVSAIIAGCGGNVIGVLHERSNEGSDVNGCYLRLTIETRDFEHIKQIEDSLKKAGFKLINN
ncbi:MAG TPA: threonine ammonia-lyase [Candidatus Coproplasma excrementavium]|nr:threonine ammonia-lyase [Candidatus Coproplasma excrementavium]